MAEIGDIDFNSVPDWDFATIPAGDYTVRIIESEVRENKKGTGKLVRFVLEILDGPHRRSRLWHYTNHVHVKPDVQTRGRRELKEIGLACGKTQYSDTRELHDIAFRVGVEVEKDASGESRNVVKRVHWRTRATDPRGPRHEGSTDLPAPPVPEEDYEESF